MEQTKLERVERELWTAVRRYQQERGEVRSRWSADAQCAATGVRDIEEGLYTSSCRCLIGALNDGGMRDYSLNAAMKLCISLEDAVQLESGFERWKHGDFAQGTELRVNAADPMYQLGKRIGEQLHREEMELRSTAAFRENA